MIESTLATPVTVFSDLFMSLNPRMSVRTSLPDVCKPGSDRFHNMNQTCLGAFATGSMNSQVLDSCLWQQVCLLFLVSFARCSDDRATRPCVDGENIVTLAHLIAPVISLTAQCKSVLFNPSLRHIGFPVSSACESFVGECSGSYAVFSIISPTFW